MNEFNFDEIKPFDPVKLIEIRAENFKRVKLFEVRLTDKGLIIIGGNNKEGKTSSIESISATLGGKRFDPSDPIRDGETRATTSVTLSNGVVVSKVFTPKNSYLTVDDPMGQKAGQQLLDTFISSFALDTGEFLRASPKKQAEILLQAIGVDLAPYDLKIKELMADREAVGREKRAAEGHASELPWDEPAGLQIKSPTSLMKELEQVIAHNAEIRKDAEKVEALAESGRNAKQALDNAKQRVESLKADLLKAEQEAAKKEADLAATRKRYQEAKQAADKGVRKDDTAIREKINDLEAFNARVRKNIQKKEAEAKARSLEADYKVLGQQIEQAREERMANLKKAGLPLPELTVENDVLLYKGREFDCMSGAEQLIVATAISKSVNPNMGFVLVEKLEQFDLLTLSEFGQWAVENDIQIIGTRVSTGDECQIIIEDGEIAENRLLETAPTPAPEEKTSETTEEYTF